MGSLLMPLLVRVAAKAGDALVGELLRAWGLDKARGKLERHLAAVHCILLDADAKSRTNPSVRRWMADLKTAAYKADDVLDEFRYEALRLRADAQIRRPSTTRKVLSYFTANSPVVFRLSMSRKMKHALEMIDELVLEMNSFHFLQHTEAPTVVHPQTHSHVNESEIVGRKDDKEQVVNILLDHSDNNKDDNCNVMVLPIVGMGGIGKTTLAQLVHNDQRVMHHFELVLWVSVSGKFIIEEIIRSIIEVAIMKKCDLTQMEALQKELCQALGKKMYLLVLDDVWNEDGHKWDDLRSLLCSHSGPGSAIIVTSRSDKVASIMGTLPPHQISLLNDDQSWEFFDRNTFGREVEKQEGLISVAKDIVHKCKGLPLAIKTIAALLRSKHHSQWFSVLDSDVWKDDILTATGIVPALRLSYDHLSSEEKICFSFCAISPKDSPMDKDMLIQLWMANDFIASETRGHQIFDVLVWRCFLQDVDTHKELLFRFERHDAFVHRPTTCKMHDLMHDLADFVSGNDCSILRETSSCQEIVQGSSDASSLQHEVQHLSVDCLTENTIIAIKGILAPRPRTILSRSESEGNASYLTVAKSKFMSLRALKTLSTITDMANLKHLRYLDCSYSRISALPGATTMLYSLQTLKLFWCTNLWRLPEGMRYMSSLRHIFLVGCHRLDHMPQGLGQLNSLRTLTSYVIDSYEGRGIDQLKDLNLGGALSLIELRKVHSAENAKQGNMSAKHNLKRLSLDWYRSKSTHFGCKVDANAEGILEALRPDKRLEVLQLCNYTGAKLSSWMHNSTLLEQLSELRLRNCMQCSCLPPLWQLPSLKYFELEGLHSLRSMCVGNDDTNNGESFICPPSFFPKLETMIVNDMPRLERWHQEVAGQVSVASFPQLKKLKIYGCRMLETLPEGLLQQLPALKQLHIRECPNLEGAFFTRRAYWDLVQAIPNRSVVPYSNEGSPQTSIFGGGVSPR
ncbi:putative disease resistance protein RGA3 [Triticum dicoccoides]|uniref:putative disease resistance protein RGA3 n=1 Tax=Triticum dicoccoides TaxID=85692 RepID=UPI00188FD7FF|nr:putative disease resistance protein RGA3 [Triticum dicoccoides]